jgi:hypothetical protein
MPKTVHVFHLIGLRGLCEWGTSRWYPMMWVCAVCAVFWASSERQGEVGCVHCAANAKLPCLSLSDQETICHAHNTYTRWSCTFGYLTNDLT